MAGALASGLDTLSGGLSALAGGAAGGRDVRCADAVARLRGDLRMTHQEVREEARQAEGDPQLKGGVRANARSAVRGCCPPYRRPTW